MSCKIGRETGDTDSLGYFSQSDVATVRYPSDNIGNDKFVLRVFGILEQESIGIPFVRVSPPFYNIPHFGSKHRPYFPYMVGRVRCLRAYKADFTVHDVPIPQEKHIPEIDSVAQVGEKPKVPVLFNGFAALVCHDFFYLFHRQG